MKPGASAESDALAGLPPVAQNQIVFYLPFRFGAARPDDDDVGSSPGLEAAAGRLAAHTDGALRQLADRSGSPSALWSQQQHAEAADRLSGDLYPVAARILCGDPDDTASGTPPFVLRRPAAGEAPEAAAEQWLARLPLWVGVGQGQLPMAITAAWVRLFGTGLGLLGVQVRIGAEEGATAQPLQADTLIEALHALTQPAKRARDAVDTAQRLVQGGSSEALKPGDLVRLEDGLFRRTQIDQYRRLREQARARADAVPPDLLRCVSCVARAPTDAGAPMHDVVCETIDVVAYRLAPRDKGREVAKNGRLQPAGAPAAGALPDLLPAAAGDAAASHRALHDIRPGEEGLAERLPRTSPLIAWMLALLPDVGGTFHPAMGGVAPVGEAAYARWRPFTYCGVRFDAPQADGAPPAQALAEFTYRLARRFDRSYRPNPNEYSASVFTPFETVRHSVDTQGAALVVWNNGVDFLKNFLSNTFATAYRPIGEVCYHEYLYLLRMVQDSAFIPKKPASADDQKALKSLIDGLTRFRLFYRFSKISHMGQHNQVQALWRRGLALDVIEADLTRDVAEAKRLVDAEVEERKDRRWLIASALGVAVSTFLAATESLDWYAQSRCPPERLQVALTDAQIYGVPVLRDLPQLLERSDLGGDVDWPPMDRVCETPGLLAREPAASAPAGQGAAYRDALMNTCSEPVGSGGGACSAPWGDRLGAFCKATQQARQCARQATTVRISSLATSIATAVLAVLAFVWLRRWNEKRRG